MSQQISLTMLVLHINKTQFADAIIGRLAMLKSFSTSDIRECKQEVIDVVVMLGISRRGLADKVRNLGKQLRAKVRIGREIGDHVNVVLWRDFRR